MKESFYADRWLDSEKHGEYQVLEVCNDTGSFLIKTKKGQYINCRTGYEDNIFTVEKGEFDEFNSFFVDSLVHNFDSNFHNDKTPIQRKPVTEK